MNLKYTGGIVGLIGVAMGPFFLLGTTGAAQSLSGMPQAIFGLCVIIALIGNVLTLRGTTRVGGAMSLAAGIVLLALPTFTGKPVTYFPGALMAIGGIISLLYKEPVMSGSQWRMRRTEPPSGSS